MLMEVASGKFRVLAVVDERENFTTCCVVTEFLHSCWANYASTVKGFRAVFDRYATGGRLSLTSAMLHEVNKEDGLYELIKGDLRIFCFFPGDGTIVLTNGVIKKGQKVDPAAVNECRRAKSKFMESRTAK
ncbi:type II toxin-antitoxin system RelE/ParE family toxin [Paraburkholderia sediminicola]|uniref:type II toxin-antitoxin system RelE/ParE family toxin n=1 Tax=Paraburkholderia sediminicola TaxID=458836 RepID=UPI0038B9D9A7